MFKQRCMTIARNNSLGKIARASFSVFLFVSFASCNRMATPPAKQILKDAEAKAASGEFLPAISLYERALDGTPESADIHYRVALLYDDKMNDPLNALHHLKRYLTLAPTGKHLEEVKNLMKRDELTLVTALSGDSVLSRAEAARVKNENLALRQQLAERSAQLKTASEKPAHSSRAEKTSSSSKHTKSTRRSRVVKNQ
jgi:tetratricopeptide (TPR) repeat protein